MADGNPVRCLILTFLLNQMLDGRTLFDDTLFEPTAREMQGRTLPRQALAEFRHERAGQWHIRLRHAGHHDDKLGRALLRHPLQTIHPHGRQIAIRPGKRQAAGNALEIFYQAKPQHDGNGPQLAQLQGLHRLIGGNEGAERLRIDLRIHMRDQFMHDVVNARQSGTGAVLETGQFPAIAAGQMPFGDLDLLFDQIKVIQQPFCSGRDTFTRADIERRLIEVSQDSLILDESVQQTVGTPPGDDLMKFGKCLRMPCQLFDAE